MSPPFIGLVEMSSQYTRTIIIYTFFPLSMYLKTLNTIWYLNLNKKKIVKPPQICKIIYFQVLSFLMRRTCNFPKNPIHVCFFTHFVSVHENGILKCTFTVNLYSKTENPHWQCQKLTVNVEWPIQFSWDH
jgi:hypothetical protein